MITIDGGPHTFWWPTQSPGGSLLPADIPPLHILRELQPTAPFLITLTDPVKRTYSDYYFLNDDLKVNRGGGGGGSSADSEDEHDHKSKSNHDFHERIVSQITAFNNCVDNISKQFPEEVRQVVDNESVDSVWFRASQM